MKDLLLRHGSLCRHQVFLSEIEICLDWIVFFWNTWTMISEKRGGVELMFFVLGRTKIAEYKLKNDTVKEAELGVDGLV